MAEANECKVYVGNLPFSVGFEELKELFSQCGEITDATVVVNKFSGRSKGFGFVTFSNKEAADKAISEMDNKDIQGRKISVNPARPLEERPKKEEAQHEPEKNPRNSNIK